MNAYILERHIASTANGIDVYAAHDTESGEAVTITHYADAAYTSWGSAFDAHSELAVLRHIHHPHVTKLRAAFLAGDGHLFAIADAVGPTLAQYMRAQSDARCRRWLQRHPAVLRRREGRALRRRLREAASAGVAAAVERALALDAALHALSGNADSLQKTYVLAANPFYRGAHGSGGVSEDDTSMDEVDTNEKGSDESDDMAGSSRTSRGPSPSPASAMSLRPPLPPSANANGAPALPDVSAFFPAGGAAASAISPGRSGAVITHSAGRRTPVQLTAVAGRHESLAEIQAVEEEEVIRAIKELGVGGLSSVPLPRELRAIEATSETSAHLPLPTGLVRGATLEALMDAVDTREQQLQARAVVESARGTGAGMPQAVVNLSVSGSAASSPTKRPRPVQRMLRAGSRTSAGVAPASLAIAADLTKRIVELSYTGAVTSRKAALGLAPPSAVGENHTMSLEPAVAAPPPGGASQPVTPHHKPSSPRRLGGGGGTLSPSLSMCSSSRFEEEQPQPNSLHQKDRGAHGPHHPSQLPPIGAPELGPDAPSSTVLPLRIDQARLVLYQLLRALAHLHRNGVIHRDIRPSTLHVDPGTSMSTDGKLNPPEALFRKKAPLPSETATAAGSSASSGPTCTVSAALCRVRLGGFDRAVAAPSDAVHMLSDSYGTARARLTLFEVDDAREALQGVRSAVAASRPGYAARAVPAATALVATAIHTDPHPPKEPDDIAINALVLDHVFTGDVDALVCPRLWYSAPETILLAPIQGPAVDVWAAAVVFIEMITGRPLFAGAQTPDDMLFRVCTVVGSPDAFHVELAHRLAARWPTRLAEALALRLGATEGTESTPHQQDGRGELMALQKVLFDRIVSGGAGESAAAAPASPGTPESGSVLTRGLTIPHGAAPVPLRAVLGAEVALPAAGVDLVTRMLAFDPAGRITAEDALQHPFFLA